jgi:hypothetical protein
MFVVWKLNKKLEREAVLFRSGTLSEAVGFALSRWSLDGKENVSMHEVESLEDESAKSG